MNEENFISELARFAADAGFRGKGPLSLALVLTAHAKESGLPLDADALVTPGGGQVRKLGRGSVQAILSAHGVQGVLAQEGGRTSRGSLNRMRAYVRFLNAAAKRSKVNLDAVERFWVEQVRAYFAGQPFRIRLDPAKGLRAAVRDLLGQAAKRQRETPHINYLGTVLQHLTGAKLDCALGLGAVRHHSASTADAPRSRDGDFAIGGAVVHVTTAPTEALIEKCGENLAHGLRAMVVTLPRGVTVAEGLAANAGILDRIDVFDAEQFLALNLYEWSKFSDLSPSVQRLIERYNEIVRDCETDPSIRIEFRP